MNQKLIYQPNKYAGKIYDFKPTSEELRLIRMIESDFTEKGPEAIVIGTHGIIADLSFENKNCHSKKGSEYINYLSSLIKKSESFSDPVSSWRDDATFLDLYEHTYNWKYITEFFGLDFDAHMTYSLMILEKLREAGPEFSAITSWNIYKAIFLYKEIYKYIFNSISYVYIMLDQINGFRKIGFSKNPNYRESTLQSEKPSIVLEYKTLGRMEDEQAFQNYFNHKRIRGEWFDLDEKDVNSIYGRIYADDWVDHPHDDLFNFSWDHFWHDMEMRYKFEKGVEV